MAILRQVALEDPETESSLIAAVSPRVDFANPGGRTKFLVRFQRSDRLAQPNGSVHWIQWSQFSVSEPTLSAAASRTAVQFKGQ
jgi:hypothetical protein